MCRCVLRRASRAKRRRRRTRACRWRASRSRRRRRAARPSAATSPSTRTRTTRWTGRRCRRPTAPPRPVTTTCAFIDQNTTPFSFNSTKYFQPIANRPEAPDQGTIRTRWFGTEKRRVFLYILRMYTNNFKFWFLARSQSKESKTRSPSKKAHRTKDDERYTFIWYW